MKVEHYSYKEFSSKYKITGYGRKENIREELKDAPQIVGFLGAMWGGHKDGFPVRRYESQEVYNRLSQ